MAVVATALVIRGKVKQSGVGHQRRLWLVREAAKGLERDETIVVRDCDRSGREGSLRDRFAEDGEGR